MVLLISSITQSSYQCDYTIEDAHDDDIFKVIPLTKNRIASCSYKTIKIWNSNYPYNLISTIKGHTSYVDSIIKLKLLKNIVIMLLLYYYYQMVD